MKRSQRAVVACLVISLAFTLLPTLVQAEQVELGTININQASVEELTQLHMIGFKYAERIVEYREKNGPFAKPEDIMNVRGVGQKTWEANKDRIAVE